MNKQIEKMSKQRQEYLKFKPFADDLRKAESWCELDGVLNRYQTAKNLFKIGYRKQEWISVEERLPTEEENEIGLIGIVNGNNGKIKFIDAIILIEYDFHEKEWWSEDYDLTGCKVDLWFPIPKAPKGGEG